MCRLRQFVRWAGRDTCRHRAKRRPNAAFRESGRRTRAPKTFARSAAFLLLSPNESSTSFLRRGFFDSWRQQARTCPKNPTIRPVLFAKENLAVTGIAVA